MLSEERRELITKEIEAKCEQGEVFFYPWYKMLCRYKLYSTTRRGSRK